MSDTMRSDRSLDHIRAIIQITLIVSTFYGVIAHSLQLPTARAELVAPLACSVSALLLVTYSSFVSAALVAVCATPLFAAILIATNYWSTVSFSWDFPEIVYAEPTKSMAVHAYLAGTSLFSLLALSLAPKAWRWSDPLEGEVRFSRAHWGPFVLGSLVIALLNQKGPFITTAGYHGERWVSDFNPGFDALWSMLSIAGLCCALRGYGHKSRQFRFCLGMVLFSLFYFRLLRGERSTAFGTAIFFSILYYKLSTSRTRILKIGAALVLSVIFLLAWAGVRATAADTSLRESLATNVSDTIDSFGDRAMMNLDRAPKLTWDLFETTYLYDQGISRGGETYLNLIAQVTPSFVADAIGVERPISEPWVLAAYFRHGGGIFAFAEAYWNFGLLGSIMFGTALGIGCVVCECAYRRLPVVLIYGYFGILNLATQTLYVGIQSVARAVEIAIALTLFSVILMRDRRANRVWRTHIAPSSNDIAERHTSGSRK